MTPAEKRAEQRMRAREALESARAKLEQLEAQERAEARKATNRRRLAVGTLADKAGLFAWDDATLRELFGLLATLSDTPNPVGMLSSMLTDPDAATVITTYTVGELSMSEVTRQPRLGTGV